MNHQLSREIFARISRGHRSAEDWHKSMSPMSMLPRMACKVWWLPQSLAEGHRTRRWYLWRQVSFGRFSDGHQRFTACAAAGDCDGQPAAWNGREFLIYIKTIARGTASLWDR